MNGYSDRINHAFAFAAKYHGAVAPVGAGMDYLAHPANVAIVEAIAVSSFGLIAGTASAVLAALVMGITYLALRRG